ncbi:MAG: lysine--tRNA ligase, partial [Clostridiales Family XIII bacterium]|nr:lysine--tRNA ligase [Clostridiales Family XIII bacterium]
MNADNNPNGAAPPEEALAALSEEKLNELHRIRRDKLNKLQEMGRNPFLVETWDVTAYSEEIKRDFDAMDGKRVSCAGRLMANRHMGKASFIDLQDKDGRIQIYVRQDAITPEEYEIFLTYDIGDIIGLEGTVFKTRHGEISVRAERVVLLSKSLRVLPNKFQGLKDTEARYRQRYVDLIVNPGVRETFVKRANIIKEIKRFMDERGFLEVDTPILTTIAGGANARPFETHHNTLNLDMKLRIS